MAERKFLDFLDMIDGGGMGAFGDEFQGGGLLSLIGNALFQPMGYRERQRAMAETRPQARPVGFLDTQPIPTSTAGYAGAGNGLGMGGLGKPGGPVQPIPTSTAGYAGAGNGLGMGGPVKPGGPVQAIPPVNATSQRNIVGSGMNPRNAYVDPTQRFAEDLIEMYGPDTANMILNSGMADQAYQSYVQRGYRF